MLPNLPRKTIFPSSMINNLINTIQKSVDENVIPIQIYTQSLLLSRVKSNPRPEIMNYDDRIFYEVKQPPCSQPAKCKECNTNFSHLKTSRHRAFYCSFCGVWRCGQCISHRMRYHPTAKDVSSRLYHICRACDDKFLFLQLHHEYVQEETMYTQAISIINQNHQNINNLCAAEEAAKDKLEEQINKNQTQILNIHSKNQIQQQNIQKIKSRISQEKKNLELKIRYKNILEEKNLIKNNKNINQSKQKQSINAKYCQQQSEYMIKHLNTLSETSHQSMTIQNILQQFDPQNKNDLTPVKNILSQQKIDSQNQSNHSKQQLVKQEQQFLKQNHSKNESLRKSDLEAYFQQPEILKQFVYQQFKYSPKTQYKNEQQLPFLQIIAKISTQSVQINNPGTEAQKNFFTQKLDLIFNKDKIPVQAPKNTYLQMSNTQALRRRESLRNNFQNAADESEQNNSQDEQTKEKKQNLITNAVEQMRRRTQMQRQNVMDVTIIQQKCKCLIY